MRIKTIMGCFFGLVAVAVAAGLFFLPRELPPYVERWVEDALAKRGINARTAFRFNYCWRNGPGVTGDFRIFVPDTPWSVQGSFGASCSEYEARVTMRETRFDERDPLLRSMQARYPFKGVSNLVFSGSVALTAQVVRTFAKPIPVWSAAVPIRDVRAAGDLNGKPVALDGLRLTPGASGLADHVDIAPVHARAKSVLYAGYSITNLHVTARPTERGWIINEAGAGICGGQVNIYSLHLDPATLNTGFTLFLDNIDAGQALSHVSNFRGEASGRLHGKLKAFVLEGGKSVRLRDAFLYSTPGETGKLRMDNSEALTENLAYAGIDAAARANVAEALTDLDYKVLRFDLKRLEGRIAQLTVQISGTATRGTATVPVDLTVNLNGELEQLINTGLGLSTKMKGNKK